MIRYRCVLLCGPPGYGPTLEWNVFGPPLPAWKAAADLGRWLLDIGACQGWEVEEEVS